MVFTLDKKKRPLGYCSPKRARQLLEKGRACVYRYYPFTVILKDKDVREREIHHNYRIKIDPGASCTGIAVVDDDRVIAYFELRHRGQEIVKALQTRKSSRRNRRSRETIYRRCKFKQAGSYETSREEGWLPPSQKSIAGNIIHFVERLERNLGPCCIDMELVRFDTQLLQNPDIEGLEYQQGTLFGYEMKAYLMEKYQHTCQYCAGETEDHRLEWEHKIPKSRGGSDRVDNATLACKTCNQLKSNRTPGEWLEQLKRTNNPSEIDQARIICLEKVTAGQAVGNGLRYAAWANSMRWRLFRELSSLSADGKVTVGTGGRTAYNRNALEIKKEGVILLEYIQLYVLVGAIFFFLDLALIFAVISKKAKLDTKKEDMVTKFLKEKDRQLSRSKTGITLQSYLLALVSCPIALAAGCAFLLPNKPIMVFPALILGVFLPDLYVNTKKRQEDKLFPDRFAKALSQMSSSLNANMSFEQSIDSVVENTLMSDTIRDDFRVISSKIKLGTPIPQAFDEYAELTKDSDVKDTAISIRIMMDVGKDEALAMKEIQKSIEGRLMYRKKRDSMMTESKIMIMFGDWMPILTVGLLYLVAPGMLSAFFESGSMMLLFAALIGMMLLGSLVMHKLIKQKRDIS